MDTKQLELELCLAKIIDKVQEQLDSLTRKNLILDSQLELLDKLTAKLTALTETYEDTLKRLPEAPYLEAKLTRLIELALSGDADESAEGQEIRKMFE